MMDLAESVAGKLKELIDNNGPKFLSADPYEVYKELVNSGAADNKTAGAVMFLLTTDILAYDGLRTGCNGAIKDDPERVLLQ